MERAERTGEMRNEFMINQNTLWSLKLFVLNIGNTTYSQRELLVIRAVLIIVLLSVPQ